jgi:hypothetical protein
MDLVKRKGIGEFMEMNIEDEVYNIKWRHERILKEDCVTPIPNGGRTVAYILDNEGTPIEAYANCSERDTYNKKLGRIIATGRVLKLLGLNTKEAIRIQ